MRRLAGVVVIAAVAFAGPAVVPVRTQAGQAAAPSGGLALSDLEARALAGHPAIRQAAAMAEAARGRRQQAGTLQNPVVGVATGEWRPRETPSGVTGAFVEQAIPLGGKRGAERREADADVDVRRAALDGARTRVLVGVRSAYYDLVAAEERVRLADRQVALAAELVTVSGQLFNIGMVDRPDVLQAEAEGARARAMRTGAVARQQGAWRHLAAAVGDGAIAPQALAASIDSALPDLIHAEAWQRILDGNPELAVARAEVVRQAASADVARRALSPDLFVRGEAAWNREHLAGGMGRDRATGWEFGAEVGVSVPIINRNAGGIAAANAWHTAAEAGEQVARLELESRFASSFADYEAARAAVVAYRTEVLPRADEAYALQIARYREMRASYSGVLLATQTLTMMQEQSLEAFEQAWRAALALEGLLVGGGK